jgi:SP family arabinose:H+ symporter-like MFS transporter
VFTVLAILLIDRVGRRPLLFAGLTGVAASLFLLAWGFAGASYAVTPATLAGLPEGVDADVLAALSGQAFADDVAFREAVVGVLGLETWQMHKAAIVATAIDINSGVVLAGVLGFVASFAVSLGPVMWVLFSELFPNRLRGLAVSVCGLLNSATSFVVQLVFPWELENFGNAATFLIYGIFAGVGLLLVFRLLPETNGRSLEELETELVGRRTA